MGKQTETYRLIYKDKEEAIADLKSRDILDEDGIRKSFPVHNVVFVGKIPFTNAVYDSEGALLTPTTFKNGYHVDVMDERLDMDFGNRRTFPLSPYHVFIELKRDEV